VGDIASEFHTYGFMIDPVWMVYYMDGKEIMRKPTQAEANTEMYVLLDLAMTAQDNNTPNPSNMLVDYVRVYQRITPYPDPVPSLSFDPASTLNKPVTMTAMNSFLKLRATSTDNDIDLIQDVANGQTDQQFVLLDAGGGSYYIRSVFSGKCITIDPTSGNVFSNGNRTVLNACANLPSQKFLLTVQADTSHELKSAQTGRCPGILAGSIAPGATVIQWDCNGTTNNHFLLRFSR
jgi:hypothetical protein